MDPPQFDRHRLYRMSDAEVRDLSVDDICTIFAADRMNLIMTDETGLETCRYLGYHPCLARLAKPSEDGNFLVLPEGLDLDWGLMNVATRSIYIRQAYKDHWKIIQHRISKKHDGRQYEVLFINGTSGGGKTVETLYLLHQILHSFDEAPPLLYFTSDHSLVVHFRGLYFYGNDVYKFSCSLSYEVMHRHFGNRHGIWQVGRRFADYYPLFNIHRDGPHIFITSPEREYKETRPFRKNPMAMIYLPLPSLEEMEYIRMALFRDNEDGSHSISHNRMMELIDAYGCNPWTVFSQKTQAKYLLGGLDELIQNRIYNIVSILERLPSQEYERDRLEAITDGDILHIMPHALKQDLISNPDPEINEMEDLQDKYQHFRYKWASKPIQDQAFESFINDSGWKQESVIRFHSSSQTWEYTGLLTDVFVQKMLTETGVAALVYDLEVEKTKKRTFGPFKNQNLYRNLSDIDISNDIINIPHTGLSATIIAVIPSRGLVFAPARTWTIHYVVSEFEELFKAGVFDEFTTRMPENKVQLVWVNTAMPGTEKCDLIGRRTALSYPLQGGFDAVKQVVMVIDLFRLCEYNIVRESGKVADMTESKWDKVKEFMQECGYEISIWGNNIRWRWHYLWRT